MKRGLSPRVCRKMAREEAERITATAIATRERNLALASTIAAPEPEPEPEPRATAGTVTGAMTLLEVFLALAPQGVQSDGVA